MSEQVHRVYPNEGTLCGHCGWLMYPDSRFPEGQPFQWIIYCQNQACPHHDIRYQLELEKFGVPVRRVDE